MNGAEKRMKDGKKEKRAKKKPLRRAARFGREVPRMALKLLTLLIAIIVMGLIFSALQGIEAVWLRVVISLCIISGMLLMCMNEGMTKGVRDVHASRTYAQAQEKGMTPGEKEDAACYRVMKAVCAAALLFAVPLALAIYIALTAREYVYTLQDLPTWLTQSYGMRADVMAPLAAYGHTASLAAEDIIRAAVRLPVMMYINLFADPLVESALIDRMTPLFLLTYPAAYLAGYLLAPRMNRKQEKLNRRAKKMAVRKAEKSTLAKTLVGDQHGVHYGHRADEGMRKKKELV